MAPPSRTFAVLLGIAISAISFAQMPPAAPPSSTTQPAAAEAAKPSDNMTGLAAVYSDKLAGHKTASGEVFSQKRLTAAHPSLPFGTKVKVTNTKNNKTVEVKINDRGPKQAGRVIDMSSAAAAKIGLGKHSTAPVQLEVVAEAPAKRTK